MSPNPSPSQNQQALILAVLMALATGVLFWPATRNEFLVYDDHDYVTGNPMVQRGLKWETVTWAFTTGHAANWHPLTWLSHALDCEFHGLNPAGHHRTSVLIHAVNAGLLLWLLWRLTGRLGCSAMAAAVFAWHPLRVESVAWVAERKDVLCALFGLLCLMAYAKYAQSKPTPHPALSPKRRGSAGWYWLALGFFALGLLCKPMLVTLPFVMLLLDVWPLGRAQISTPHPTLSPNEAERAKQLSTFNFQLSTWKPPVVEKVPFLVLVVASCVATYAAQKAGGAVRDFGIASRLANIPVAYLQYVKKFFCPTELAVIYPLQPVAAGAGLVAALVLAGLCVAAWRAARSHGYVFTGWFWFIGMLVPVIGVIQVGYQAFADRYTYLPAIGLSVAVIWGVAAAGERWKRPRAVMWAASLAVLGLLPYLTRDYLQHWKSTTDLFEHAVSVTGPHTIALKNMGMAYMERGGIL